MLRDAGGVHREYAREVTIKLKYRLTAVQLLQNKIKLTSIAYSLDNTIDVTRVTQWTNDVKSAYSNNH